MTAMRRVRARPLAAAVAGGALVAAVSLLAGPVVAGYDPLAWLAWGREVARLDLDTVEGPAFKPLPVVVIAPVAGALGDDAALHWWLLVARTAAVAAPLVAALLAWRIVRAGAADPGGAILRAGRAAVDEGPGPRQDGGPARARPRLPVRVAPVAAAVLAGLAVGLTGDWWRYGLPGAAEPLVVLAGLAAVLEHRAGRPGRAWAWVAVAVLLRAEAWPFAVLYGAWLLRSRRTSRTLRVGIAATAVALPTLWIGAEWWGSGDPGRSSDRARIPNPGQPALDDHPFVSSVAEGVPSALWPLLLVLVLAAAVGTRTVLGGARPAVGRAARAVGTPAGSAPHRPPAVRSSADLDLAVLVALGAGWSLLVAAMSEWGYSGEARYHLPGAAVLGVAGAVALGRQLARPAGRGTTALLVAVLVAAAIVASARTGGAVEDWRSTRAEARLQQALWRAVELAGERPRVLACGRPVIGHFRAPQLAWPLDVHKAVVDEEPRPAPSVVFRGPLIPGGPASPDAPRGHALVARSGPWTVHARCSPPREAPNVRPGRPFRR